MEGESPGVQVFTLPPRPGRLMARTAPFQGAEQGSEPCRATTPPSSKGRTPGSQPGNRGSVPRGGTHCEIAQEAEHPAVTRTVGGSWPSLAASTPDGRGSRQPPAKRLTGVRVSLGRPSRGGRSAARTSACQVDNRGSSPRRHTLRVRCYGSIPVFQTGRASSILASRTTPTRPDRSGAWPVPRRQQVRALSSAPMVLRL